MNIKEFSNIYISSLTKLMNNIDTNIFQLVIEELKEVQKNKGTIYVIGNGGSASTASHIVNDFGIGLKKHGVANYNIVSLADNIAVTSAIANDLGYDNIFYQQLKNILEKKDLLIAISCSGNSENIIKSVLYAKKLNCITIGLTGFEGGQLKDISDINFHIDTPKGEYGLVEDMHMIFNHLLYSFYLNKAK